MDKCQVFISCKSQDKSLAEEVYASLKAIGFNVFFSPVTLQEEGISEFKLAIDQALEEASVMVVVGTSRAYLESKWVRYEWNTFQENILNGQKADGKIFTYVSGISVGDLPIGLRNCEMFFHSLEELDRLRHFVNNALKFEPVSERAVQVKTKRVELILEGEFNGFTPIRQQDIIDILAVLLRIDPIEIRVLNVLPGSIKIIVEMPDIAANRLYEIASRRDFGIMDLRIRSILVEGREVIKFPKTNVGRSFLDSLFHRLTGETVETAKTTVKAPLVLAESGPKKLYTKGIIVLIVVLIGLLGVIVTVNMGYKMQIASANATNQAIDRLNTQVAAASMTAVALAQAGTAVTPSVTASPQPSATFFPIATLSQTPDVTPDHNEKALIILVKLEDRSSGNYHGDDPTTIIYDKMSAQIDADNLPVDIQQLDHLPSLTELQTIGQSNWAIIVLTGWYDANSLTYHLDVDEVGAQGGTVKITDQFDEGVDFPSHTRYLCLFVLGLERYFRGDLSMALAYFNEALTMVTSGLTVINPADTYFVRGLIYHTRHEFTNAIGDYSQAIQNKPGVAEYYNSRAAAYDDMGDESNAIADYNKAIQLKPDSADYYQNRGNAYLHSANYTKAIEDYTQSISLAPDNADAYTSRGDAYENSGNHPLAIADFTRAILLQPDYAVPYNERGITYYDMSNYQQAIADFNQAIRLDSKYADAYSNRGLTYTAEKKYALAISDLSIAIKLDPVNPIAYLNRGIAYKFNGDIPNAIADFKAVLTLNPDPNVRQDALDQLNKLSASDTATPAAP